MKIDLHTHSYFSDGELSPEELVKKAKDTNVSIFAITDHNFLTGTKTLKEEVKKDGMVLIDGIEISTLYRLPSSNISLHVLGYGKKLDGNILNNNLQKTIDGYNNRARTIIKAINTAFPTLNLNFDTLKKNSTEAYISRNTLARLLVKHLNNGMSIKDALREYVFAKEDDSWMMTPEESFRIITNAGGIPVLAHSGRELRKMGINEYEKMIAYFTNAGLLGLEIYYPKHTDDEIAVMKSIAHKYKLYITGGSDWHGHMYTPNSVIGRDVLDEDIYRFLRDVRIGIL
jgi:predicted metal-dependent phosphoesterase TrpH